MKKKFKVRVKFDFYYSNKSWYKVQYAYYRFIPNWKSIYVFCTLADDGFRSDRMFTDYDEAVSFANKINSINDVDKIHEIEHIKYREWKDFQNEMWNKNKPKHKITNVR